MHGVKHTIERPFHCVHLYCDYRAKTRNALSAHVKLRNQEIDQWYSCSFGNCNYKTRYRHYLQTHSTIHTGVKSFKCSLPKLRPPNQNETGFETSCNQACESETASLSPSLVQLPNGFEAPVEGAREKPRSSSSVSLYLSRMCFPSQD